MQPRLSTKQASSSLCAVRTRVPQRGGLRPQVTRGLHLLLRTTHPIARSHLGRSFYYPADMFQLGQTSKQQRLARETGVKKKNAGQLRITKDVSELDAPKSVHVEFPEPDNLMLISLTLEPEEGYYHKGSFKFTINIPIDYPHSPPKVKCETDVYHPNIDEDGNVCLNILRQDWKPVLTLSAVLYGLVLLFLSPNPDDPLNKDAADTLKRDKSTFRRNVDASIRGGYVGGRQFKSSRR